jgi:hypothetical protein
LTKPLRYIKNCWVKNGRTLCRRAAMFVETRGCVSL